MTVERIALAVLALLAGLSVVTLGVASARFGDAAATLDEIEHDLAGFEYQRGDPTVGATLVIDNSGRNDTRIVYIEYTFVVNGVVAGGGDSRPGEVIPAGDSSAFDLQGRITDVNYVERQPEDAPLRWIVNGRIQVNVDDRMDSVFIPFAYRVESP